MHNEHVIKYYEVLIHRAFDNNKLRFQLWDKQFVDRVRQEEYLNIPPKPNFYFSLNS